MQGFRFFTRFSIINLVTSLLPVSAGRVPAALPAAGLSAAPLLAADRQHTDLFAVRTGHSAAVERQHTDSFAERTAYSAAVERHIAAPVERTT